MSVTVHYYEDAEPEGETRRATRTGIVTSDASDGPGVLASFLPSLGAAYLPHSPLKLVDFRFFALSQGEAHFELFYERFNA